MDLGLSGLRVVVTGGGSNIGRAIVHGFAGAGARVAICDVDENQAARVDAEARERGASDTLVVTSDLAVEGNGRRAVEQATAAFGGVDVLVNNVGINVPGFLTEQTDRELWQRTIEVNLFAAIECTQAAIAPMRQAGDGAIVCISSDAAYGAIRQGIYGTSKAGLIALARTVAREHGRHGIRSNVVCPGLVMPDSDTAIGASSLWAEGTDAIFNDKQVDYVLKNTPLQRLTEATDIAHAVLFLASPVAARQVTGQVLAVGGGSVMP
jgi:2-hydroxycyclohexanecarboxyl-CoA dehydrogenase